jgi:Fe-S oxidoreductase
VIEFARDTFEAVKEAASLCEKEMRENGLGYHFPLLTGADTKKIWTLRKAGLGLLGNLPGDDKAVPVIEDTAVDVNDLPAYIHRHGLYSVHYAHAGSGELHLRPILNLKTTEGHRLFRVIAEEIATLVKKYQGSLSGEHGDGRLRGEFIPQMIGNKNYALLKQIKESWDPRQVFNPGKIVDTPPMDTHLRYDAGQHTPPFPTIFRFQGQDILQHAEQCNGSGDCRKTHLSGGTMCPSYMATREEKDTTRARANILREFLTRSAKTDRYDHREIYEVMDLCLSCKACKSECPSNVDVAKLKAEFLQHYYDANGVPFRARLIAGFTSLSALASLWPQAYNFAVGDRTIGSLIKRLSGFAPQRSLPEIGTQTLKHWWRHHQKAEHVEARPVQRKVYLFCDEFTNYSDPHIGQAAITLLERLGYDVVIPDHLESGRTWLSKGLIRRAQKIVHRNLEKLAPLIGEETPLIGIEPSAILTFRDEYVDLASDQWLDKAKQLARNVFTLDEFISREFEQGRIRREWFTDESLTVKLHGHCQQKSLSAVSYTQRMLTLPVNYKVEVIPSGCCGMAGSFGYEQEHYELSMKIGELVLFPAVRNRKDAEVIAAPGTSCRHQIKDGTGEKSYHPAEILLDALR